MVIQTVYLGDAVYASFSSGQILIFTSNGMEHSDPIYMEPETLGALFKYATECLAPNLEVEIEREIA